MELTMNRMFGPFLIILCSILWSTDTLFRVPLMRHMNAIAIVLLEHLIALAFMVPLMFSRTDEFTDIKPTSHYAIAFIGIFGSGIATLALTTSFSYINPTVAILLQKLQPIVALTGARLLLKEKIKPIIYLLGIFAILGAVLLTVPEAVFSSNLNESDFEQINMFGVMLALIASICWGLCTVFGRFVSFETSHQTISFLRFAWGLITLFVIQGLIGKPMHMTGSRFNTDIMNTALLYFGHNPQKILNVLYMGVVSGVIAMNLYYAGIKRTTATVTAFCELTFPLAAVVINWIFLDKPLSRLQLIGAGLLLISVLTITLIQQREEESSVPES